MSSTVAAAAVCGRTVGDGAHPLSSLSGDEITHAAEILRTAGLLHDDSRIGYLGLDEPTKRQLRDGTAGRRARAQLVDPAGGTAHEVLIDLATEHVVRQRPIDPVSVGQVPLLAEEHELLRRLLRADPGWLRALAARGITDPDTVCLAGLSAGRFDIPGEQGRRMVRVLGHHQPVDGCMPWAHPIDGLVAFVDIGAGEVTEVVDTGAVPIPAEHGDFHRPGAYGPDREDVKPIVITQPDGPSFSVDGDLLRWQNWSLRLGYDMREGLVLHQIGFASTAGTVDGNGTAGTRTNGRDDSAPAVRPIVHRASISEMLVSYADPGPIRFWQNYFDTGEYLLGRLANSLELGCDCVGDITYFDVVLPDGTGRPRRVPQAICLHEEDAGVLWKHTEQFTGTVDVRRNRRLVISFFVTVGNYDYGFYWYLYLDGRIEFEAKATGVVFTAAMDQRTSRFASELAPGLAAPYHQHLFCARLDMAVDGEDNCVDEIDAVGVATSPDNPTGTTIAQTVTRLTTEAQGRRHADNRRGRIWRVSNPGSRNRLGRPVAYDLRPEGSPVLLAQPDSVIARRAAFATADLWVTAFDPDERFPAGEIVNQSAPGHGLPAYTADDRSIEDADVVLWHTFGLTHYPRTEDWPVMPVDRCGFVLTPYGFFDRNPTLDVPAGSSAGCCSGGDRCGCRHGDGTDPDAATPAASSSTQHRP